MAPELVIELCQGSTGPVGLTNPLRRDAPLGMDLVHVRHLLCSCRISSGSRAALPYVLLPFDTVGTADVALGKV